MRNIYYTYKEERPKKERREQVVPTTVYSVIVVHMK